jgi:hypothetical protein
MLCILGAVETLLPFYFINIIKENNLVTDKYRITEYKQGDDGKIMMVQSFKKTEEEAKEYANSSDAEYIIINDLENKQIFTKGVMPTIPSEVESKPLTE